MSSGRTVFRSGGRGAGFASPFLRLLFALLALAVVAWWVAAMLAAAREAPRFSAMARLDAVVAQGGELVLGRAELMQPQGAQGAELRHVRLRASPDGRLLISRVAELRGLNVEFGEATEEGSSERFELSREPGAVTELTVGAQKVRISVEGEKTKIAVGTPDGAFREHALGRRGLLILPGGEPGQRCFEPDLLQWLREQLSALKAFSGKGTETVVVLGGDRSCLAGRIPLVAMPMSDPAIEFALRRNLSDGRLYLGPLRGSGLAPVSYETRAAGTVTRAHAGASGIEWPVAPAAATGHPPVTHFTAGRTRYSISAEPEGENGWAVAIVPVRRVALFVERICEGGADTAAPEAEDCPPPLAASPNVVAAGGELDASSGELPPPLARMFVGSMEGLSRTELVARLAAIGLAFAILYLLPTPALAARGRTGAICSALAVAVVCVLALAPELVSLSGGSGDAQSDARILLASTSGLWIAATVMVALDRAGGWRIGLFWFVLAAVVAIGSVSLFTMSLEGPNTDWERFFVKHKLAVLDTLPLLAIALAAASPTSLRLSLGNDLAGRPSGKSPMLWLMAAVVALFAAWLVIGNQQGLFGSFQPVEAGKFAMVAFLGAALAQWLIRARLVSQAWFGLTLLASVLALAFIAALLVVPALMSDYSPLIIIGATALGAGVLGAASIGHRIREENRADSRSLLLLPLPFLPEIRDSRAAKWPLKLVMAGMLILAVHAALRGDRVLAGASLAGAAVLLWLALRRKRMHNVLATLAISGPLVAGAGLYLLRDMPVETGLGVAHWSWRAPPDEQIERLQAVLGEGRRLPKERVMSWADLRYGDPGAEPRTLALPDMDFHVMRSRAALARAPCRASREFRAAPAGMGEFVGALGEKLSNLLGGECEPYGGPTEKPSCSPASLRGHVRAHCVPVVQSDFAATYLAARHGIPAVALLAVFQIMLAAAALSVFLRLQAKRSRDPVETGADQAMALIALGCGMLFAMQWLLAWSNAFGLLPVMGQPMTWLSAATSHHLFMGIPAVLAIMAAIRLAGLRDAALTFREPPRWRR